LNGMNNIKIWKGCCELVWECLAWDMEVQKSLAIKL
jgi:hypothetical protein